MEFAFLLFGQTVCTHNLCINPIPQGEKDPEEMEKDYNQAAITYLKSMPPNSSIYFYTNVYAYGYIQSGRLVAFGPEYVKVQTTIETDVSYKLLANLPVDLEKQRKNVIKYTMGINIGEHNFGLHSFKGQMDEFLKRARAYLRTFAKNQPISWMDGTKVLKGTILSLNPTTLNVLDNNENQWTISYLNVNNLPIELDDWKKKYDTPTMTFY